MGDNANRPPTSSQSSHLLHQQTHANMADAPRGGAAARGGAGGFGSRGGAGGDRGDRGRGRGRRGPRRGANKNEEKEWQPVTKLGRLVKDGKIKSMEEIYLHSLPIKEYQIVDFFLPKLKDEVMKIKPVQKQTRAGQRTRFKAIVVIGDSEGHVGLGIKTSKEVATAIRAAIIIAKLSVLPIRRGYWVPTLVFLTLCQPRRVESVVPFPSDLSQLPVVPVLSHPQPSSVFSNLPVSTTSTLPPPDPPRPSRTPSRPPSSLSETHTDTSHPTCGRRRSSSAVLWRSLVMFCALERDTRWCFFAGVGNAFV